jgi:hypothetical protein
MFRLLAGVTTPLNFTGSDSTSDVPDTSTQAPRDYNEIRGNIVRGVA